MTSENTRELPDTVENAAATPGQDMPWKELGLKEDEYQRICDILGRRPTNAELAMYSVMWSEHCSYKSSKKHLAEQFGARTTDAMRKNLLVGMGQNAGVVDIGGGWAVTFKVESHNHPSFVEPYQGAATGVGGIVRDIISMGARPIAVMDQLRFGAVDHPDTARVVHGVVSGVGGYGNCLGLPNIGGETEFDPSYQGNPLVNALCIGKLRHDDIHLANATGEGNLVVLFGARTGGDGAEPSGSKNVGCGQERGEGRLVLGPSSRNDDERSVGQRDSRVLSLGSLDEAAVDATRLVAGAAYLTRVVGEAEGADDEVADLHVFHGVPDFGDRSHVFVAHRPSARRLEAAVRPQIRSADAGGGDLDDGVGRFDDGGDVEVFDPDVARAVHDCSSHGVSFRSLWLLTKACV